MFAPHLIPFRNRNGVHEREKINERYKKTIQHLFKSEMGLLLDNVKPGGSGTPKDGNTARSFFND
jgi:hypothetical protein